MFNSHTNSRALSVFRVLGKTRVRDASAVKIQMWGLPGCDAV